MSADQQMGLDSSFDVGSVNDMCNVNPQSHDLEIPSNLSLPNNELPHAEQGQNFGSGYDTESAGFEPLPGEDIGISLHQGLKVILTVHVRLD